MNLNKINLNAIINYFTSSLWDYACIIDNWFRPKNNSWYLVSDPSLFVFRVADPSQRENLGIIVQYKVKVKLCLGALGG